MCHEGLCFGRFQFLLVYDALQVGIALLCHVLVPVVHHIGAVRWCHALQELLYQVALVAQVGTCGNGLLYLHHHLLVLAIALMVFGHQGKDVFYAYLHLLHQFYLEHHIIVHPFLVSARFVLELVAQVYVPRGVILYLVVAQHHPVLAELVKRG